MMPTFKIHVYRTVNQVAELIIDAKDAPRALAIAAEQYEDHYLSWTIEGEDRDVIFEIIN